MIVVLDDPIAYRALQYLSNFLKEGLLEKDNMLFETIEAMYEMSASGELSPKIKSTLTEVANGLFSHACNVLQGNTALTIKYLEFLLKAMLREGSDRWNGYSACGPMLMSRLDAFLPYASLLLKVMAHFPETLSVIHDLYQLAPAAFFENMPFLVKLYESNHNGQLSILDIVRDLARQHPEIVAPHLAALLRIAHGVSNDDVVVVKEIETTCATAVRGFYHVTLHFYKLTLKN
jgi:hypothetical protein